MAVVKNKKSRKRRKKPCNLTRRLMVAEDIEECKEIFYKARKAEIKFQAILAAATFSTDPNIREMAEDLLLFLENQ